MFTILRAEISHVPTKNMETREIIFHLLKHNKTDGFAVLCVLVLFKFEVTELPL